MSPIEKQDMVSFLSCYAFCEFSDLALQISRIISDVVKLLGGHAHGKPKMWPQVLKQLAEVHTQHTSPTAYTTPCIV